MKNKLKKLIREYKEDRIREYNYLIKSYLKNDRDYVKKIKASKEGYNLAIKDVLMIIDNVKEDSLLKKIIKIIKK